MVFLANTHHHGGMAHGSLLSTGQAATQLGVSRQHVVNMCDDGRLPFTRVGTHRRIPSDAVDAYVFAARGWRADGHQRSLALHALVVSKLISDPEAVVAAAKSSLNRSTGITVARTSISGRRFLTDLSPR